MTKLAKWVVVSSLLLGPGLALACGLEKSKTAEAPGQKPAAAGAEQARAPDRPAAAKIARAPDRPGAAKAVQPVAAQN